MNMLALDQIFGSVLREHRTVPFNNQNMTPNARKASTTRTALATIPLSVFLACSPNIDAQEAVPVSRLEIPSSFNPVGSGARAMGMGGAFIGFADDATAASWNPGGLANIRTPRFTIVGDGLWRKEDNSFELHPEGDNTGRVDQASLNYLSASYPFMAMDRPMFVSLNYQKLYEFGREWDFGIDTVQGIVDTHDNHQYDQDGALYALGLAYSVAVTPEFSVGVTLNIWEDFFRDNSWEQNYRVTGSGSLGGIPYQLDSGKRDEFSFSGINANFGLLWRVRGTDDRLRVGAVLKTPFDADIEHTTTESYSLSFASAPEANVLQSPIKSRIDETLKMPMSYGIGIAFDYSDNLTLAADVYRTEWSRFALKGPDGVKRSPLSGRPISEVGDIEDTVWFRVGAEYRYRTEGALVNVRGGAFYDPAPAEGNADDFYGFTLGAGISMWKNAFVDLAYQYRVGNDVGSVSLPQVGFSQDVTEHRLYGSVTYRFQ